ncbi:uncharacterized protein [Pagrus major]|uniref:uncharacterized protein n=1 Tax=Pagrus major TaxID=143350 RepID=UPI003CC8E248
MQQGNGLQSPLRPLSVLFFHLLLAHSCTGQSQLIAPSQPIVAKVGDDIILPCHLEPEVDVVAMTLEWTRSDLNPRFVHMRRAGQDLLRIQHPSYKGRTSVSIDELKHGNVSLKLSEVKPSDAGRYKCYIPKLDTGSVVELVVGAASSLVISLSEIDRNKGAVVLQCESTGWYPEPEVFWLDAEGNLLSAGPTETVRGPDDLYTVSSRVTVERRHSNSFTCRVQQNHINQTRETLTFISDDFFEVQSSSSSTTVGLVVILAVCILVILILVFFVWRQNNINTKRRHRDETDEVEKNQECEPLTTEERKPMKLKEEQQRREEAENKVQALEEEQQKKTRGEQQRREAAEKILKLLKEELETKKTELQKKQADLQQLHEEKQRKEKNLQRLKERLEKKNTEVETAEAAIANHWFSWEEEQKKKKKKKKKKMEAENEVKTLKKLLETEEMELDTKTKEFDEKQVEVQQLQDVIQGVETNLKTLMEEPESSNKEVETSEAALTKHSWLSWRESEEQDSSSQSSTREPAVGVKFDPHSKYIQLINKSTEDQQLGGWDLLIQVKDSEPIKRTFKDSFSLKAGQLFTVRYRSSEDKVQVSLISCPGNIQYNYSY